VDALIGAGHKPSLLVRTGSESKVSRASQCKLVAGSLSDLESIRETVDQCDAVIYNAGILRESTRDGTTFENIHYRGVVSVVDTAIQAGTKRFLLMSANGIHSRKTPYQETKSRAEEYVRQSSLAYTIFRPSVIFGDPRGNMEIATQLYEDMIRKSFPAIGFHTGLIPSAGAIMMSPVFVEDVAEAFVRSLDNPDTIRKEYALGGPQQISWTGMLECIARAVRIKKITLPMPISLMQMAAILMDWIPVFPVTRDQLTMLAEGNTASDLALRALIECDPVPFVPETLAYLRR
jgi:NADH dehydrogenase